MTEKTTHTLTVRDFDRQTTQPAFIAIKNIEDGRDDLFLTFDTFAAATSTLAVLMGWPIERLFEEQRMQDWVESKADAVLPYSDVQDIHIGIMGGG
jgi:hypothetical protein